MKILAINGSHRAGKGTSAMLQEVLASAQELGAETELIELSKASIDFCIGCNKCLRGPECSIKDDDMEEIVEKMKAADAIVVGSPNYFANVSARMKNFFDRSRPLHMTENVLRGKLAGIVVSTGLNGCGAEATTAAIERFFSIHEMRIIVARPEGPVVGQGTIGSMQAGVDENCNPVYRRIQDDAAAMRSCRKLGADLVAEMQLRGTK